MCLRYLLNLFGRHAIIFLIKLKRPTRHAFAGIAGWRTNQDRDHPIGMQLFDQHLADLYNEDTISAREALRLATNPEALTAAMRGISRAETSGGLVQ